MKKYSLTKILLLMLAMLVCYILLIRMFLNLLLEYFNSINLNGYDYAYLYVGMNHVLQAVGRLIRTETDRGSILLIDKRYAYKKYKTLFPSTFVDYKNIKDVEEIKNNLVQFYKN